MTFSDIFSKNSLRSFPILNIKPAFELCCIYIYINVSFLNLLRVVLEEKCT